jgi:predicted metalloprotease
MLRRTENAKENADRNQSGRRHGGGRRGRVVVVVVVVAVMVVMAIVAVITAMAMVRMTESKSRGEREKEESRLLEAIIDEKRIDATIRQRRNIYVASMLEYCVYMCFNCAYVGLIASISIDATNRENSLAEANT